MEWPHCELKRRVDPPARDAGGIGAVITAWREPRYRYNRSRVIFARNRCGLIPQASSFIGSIHRSRSNSRRSLNFSNRCRVKSSRLKTMQISNRSIYYIRAKIIIINSFIDDNLLGISRGISWLDGCFSISLDFYFVLSILSFIILLVISLCY